MSRDFFAKLPAVSDYLQMVDPGHYFDLPADWSVVLTDVKNSTKAIDAGRYKEVNMVGVSCIIAVQNALKGQIFPYIFGGDGATLAVPNDDIEQVKTALSHTRQVARREFALELRIAVIPARDLLKAGASLKVAKLQVSEHQYLALVRGDGWTTAEKWMKEREAEFNLSEDVASDGDIGGLECRWNPLPARKHEVLALIVQGRAEGERQREIYRNLLVELLRPELKPISLVKLKLSWPPKYLKHEARMRAQRGMARLLYLCKTGAVALAHALILASRGKKNISKPLPYLQELTQNTDYVKFDEALRMIIDVSKEQKERLLAILEQHYRAGEIFYGYHADANALLTCYIQGPHKHIHFVDAGGGGYAMAAKGLKAQRRAAG